METKLYAVDQIQEAAAAIRAGQLVAFPTETVYGLGANALDEAAVKKVYAAKGRPSDNPLIVHVASVAMVEELAAAIPERARKLMDHFWPGSLTIILPVKPGALSKTVTGGLTTVAFRYPANESTLNLIKTAGVPLVGPSANTSGKPSPTTAMHVYHDLKGKIAGIVDDGPTKVGLESTVLDLSTDQPAILRPGAVTKAQIEDVIGSIDVNHHHVKANETPKAPGMKYKHYAPNAQVTIVEPSDDWHQVADWLAAQSEPVAVMATDAILQDLPELSGVERFSLGNDVVAASHWLFDGLRHFDNEPAIKQIIVEGFAPEGLAAAYMNRLNKSAGGQTFAMLES